MIDAEKPWRCVSCKVKMNRDFQADIPFASGDYHHGAIHSDSLAISPDQRAEHLKTFPNIKLDSENRPVFDNFQNHQAYLDKCNIVKDRKKIKPKGVRIA
jgi:hypothetical protein